MQNTTLSNLFRYTVIGLLIFAIYWSNRPSGKTDLSSLEQAPMPSKKSSVVDLLPNPNFDSPVLQVHAGKIENNRPKIETPHMKLPPYELSGWELTQWKKITYLMPGDAKETGDIDPLLGKSLYTMKASSKESELKVFPYPNKGTFVFQLTGRDGWLHSAGGSNVFLSASVLPDVENTFDSQITLSLESKLISASAKADSLLAGRDGSVVGQYFSGFTVSYSNPQSGRDPVSLFIQIHHADTRGKSKHAYRGCYPHNNYQEIVFSTTLPGDHFFSSVSKTTEPLTPKEFNITKYLCEALVATYNCTDDEGKKSQKDFKNYAQDLAHWKIGSFYTGVETQAAHGDQKPGPSRGKTEMSVQVASLRLTRDTATTLTSCQKYFDPNFQDAPPQEKSSACSKGSFKNDQGQTIEFACGCTNPVGTGWVLQKDGCFHRVSPK